MTGVGRRWPLVGTLHNSSRQQKRRQVRRSALQTLESRRVFTAGVDDVCFPVDLFLDSSADLVVSTEPVRIDRQANLQVETDTLQDWGINLNAPSDFSAISAWVDLTKKFRRFGSPDQPWLLANNGAGFNAVTNQGIPLQDFGAAWVHLGDPLGIYNFRYEGTASVSFHGAASIVPGSTVTVGNVTTMQVLISTNDNCWVTFHNVTSGNPVKNLRMVASDLDINTTETFRPDFKARLAPFSTIRFMDWNLTNNSQATTWSERRLPNWTLQTEPAADQERMGGVAWEYMIRLANEVGKDAWINIPHLATDTYIRELAKLWRDNLNPNLKVYVEFSNENWNPIFYQFHQSLNGSGHDYSLEGNAASQIVRVGNIFREEFYGSTSGTVDSQGRKRLNINLAAFATSQWVVEQGISYFTSHGLIAKNVIDSISIAPYIDLPRDQVYNTVDDVFAGLRQQVSGIASHGLIAAREGIQLLAYEAGQHLSPVLIENNAAQPQLDAIMLAAQSDPRMGELYREYVQLWQQAGGGIISHFAYIDPGSRYGYWSLLTDPTSPGSVKWDTVLDTALRSGDATLDHLVTMADFSLFQQYFGSSNRWWQQGDFNGDHQVDGLDLQTFYANASLSAMDAETVRTFAAQHNVLLNEFSIALPEIPSGTVTVSIAAGAGIQVEPSQISFAANGSALTPQGIKVRSIDSAVTQSVFTLTFTNPTSGVVSTRDVPILIGNFSQSVPLSGADTTRVHDVYSIQIGQLDSSIAASVTGVIVDWGDGRVDALPTDHPVLLHSYATAGNYSIGVSLKTASGTLPGAGTLNVTALAAPTPTATIQAGLLAEIYSSTALTGSPSLLRVDPTIDFDFASGGVDSRVISNDTFAVRWSGTITPKSSATYSLTTSTGATDKVRLWIANNLVIDTFSAPTASVQSASVTLLGGQATDVRIEYIAGIGASKIALRWESATGLKQAIPSSVLQPSSLPSSANGLLGERFFGVAGTGLDSLYSDADYIANRPDAAERFSSATLAVSPGAASTSPADEAGRYRGYLIAPETGEYKYALSGSVQASLRLGTDDSASNLTLLSTLTTPTSSNIYGPTSQAVYLVAGQRYYFEFLYRYVGTPSTNHVSIGWTKPSDSPTQISAIPITSLQPVLPQVTLRASSSQTNEAVGFNQGAGLVVERSDDLGRPITVYFVLGGTATNGVDYRTLSGSVTIPARAVSATIRIDPIDDNVLEGFETVIVRLVSSSDYWLGEESDRRATVTIAGEAIAASTPVSGVSSVQLIPGAPENRGGFDASGQIATFANTTNTDPSLPFIDAFTVQTTQSQYPFTVRRIWQDFTAPIAAGDLLAVSFWARSLNADGSNASIGMRSDKRSPNYQGVNGSFTVTSQWKEFHLAFAAPVAYATNDIKLELQFGYNGQTVEVGGVKFNNYAQGISLLELNELLDQSDRYKSNDVGLTNRTTTGNATFTTQTISDPAVPFTTATRVAVNSFVNDYDVRVIWSNQTAIAQGDVMLASVYARTISPLSGQGRISLRLEQPSPPYTGEQAFFDVTSEWQQFVFPFTAPVNYGVGGARFDVRFGYLDQTVEIGSVRLLNFHDQVPLASLPKNIYSYGGRGQSSDWRGTAAADAYTHRNDPLMLTINGAAAGTAVTLRPLTPEYKLGTAANYQYIAPTAGSQASSATGLRYRSVLLDLFDRITDENAEQWSSWLDDPNRAIEVAAWANANNLPIHGHSVIWGNLDGFPTPRAVRTQYNTLLSTQGSTAATDYLKAQILANIQTGSLNALKGNIFDSTEPIIEQWDVQNHPLLFTQFKDIVGQSFLDSAIIAARDIANPKSSFFVNEDSILTRQFGGYADAFYALLADYLTRGLPIDGAGFQSHFDSQHLPTIDSIVGKLERFAGLGLALQSTEFDVDSTYIDRQTQADFTRDFLLATYANPSTTATTFWGYWQGEHWRSAENAGLFETDWSVKPNGQVLLDNVSEQSFQFRTDAAGKITTTLPRGEYEASVVLNGTPVVTRLSVDAGGTITQIEAPPPSNTAPSDILLAQSAINENTSTAAADLLFTQLSAVDLDATDTHTFDLVSGTGDSDNADFRIVGNQLFIRQGRTINYESKPDYSIRIKTTDTAGADYERQVSLTVNNLVEISKSNVSINNGNNQRSRVTSVAIQFDSPVVLSPGAIVITKRGTGGGAAGINVTPAIGTTSQSFTVTFAGAFNEVGSLVDGNYDLSINGQLVTNAAGFKLDANRDGITGDSFVYGNDPNDRFFRFFGDSDGDRDTDAIDLLFFRRSLLQAPPSPLYQSFFDFDSDGDVDAIDLLHFRRRLGLALPG